MLLLLEEHGVPYRPLFVDQPSGRKPEEGQQLPALRDLQATGGQCLRHDCDAMSGAALRRGGGAGGVCVWGRRCEVEELMDIKGVM